MTLTIIITAYIINIFLNRWLNKIGYENDIIEVKPMLWFIPFITTMAFACMILDEYRNSWFTGENWKQK